MRAVVLAALVAAPCFAQPAFAQTADDIVKFFDAAALGQPRRLCVGTEEECRAKDALDMRVNFELDSADLTPEAQAKLDEFAAALLSPRLLEYDFAVEGYTDATGDDTHNDLLSQQRAYSVAAFLVKKGVAPSRLEAVGFGEKSPREKDPFDPANRRVEMRIKLQ
jgi:outer membrane protein OmpA-like peptidoglycan-associated protein